MKDQHTWVLGIIIGAFAIGAGFGTIAAYKAGFKKLFARAPGPKWTFDSWATNITAVAGALGTVLAGTTLSDDAKPVGQNAFVALSLFFGLLVLAGPLVFQCIRNPNVSPTDPDAGLWGFNFTLLLACELTLAAVTGGLSTLTLLYWEILGGGTSGVVAVVAAGCVGLILAYYFFVTVPALVGAEWKTLADTTAAQHRAAIASAFNIAPTAVVLPPGFAPVPSW